MGIDGIHILFEVDTDDSARRMQEAAQVTLIMAHRRGEHPYGSMIRECPLCQAGK